MMNANMPTQVSTNVFLDFVKNFVCAMASAFVVCTVVLKTEIAHVRQSCYRPRTKGRYCFHRCVYHWERYPSFWSQVPSQPLVLGPFLGDTPVVTGDNLDWSTLCPQDRNWGILPPVRNGVSPSQDWGTPLAKTGLAPSPSPQRGEVMLQAVCLLRYSAGKLFCFNSYFLV